MIATESTVRGGAYQQAIARIRPDARGDGHRLRTVRRAGRGGLDRRAGRERGGRALPGAAARSIAALSADTLVLGCTHFPVLKSVDRRRGRARACGIVDSAATTAQEVRQLLAARGLQRPPGGAPPKFSFLATDAVNRFAEVGGRFFGAPIAADEVELIDL